jgi:GTPase SAR1 family protein
VYDITNGKSLARTKSWTNEVKSNNENALLPIVLVGNKCELSSRLVSDMETEAYSTGTPHFKVNAKENINIKNAFVELAKLMVERQNIKTLQDIILSPTDKSKRSCCK